MSYEGTIWKNGATEVSAENLNKMEDRMRSLGEVGNPNLLINGDFQVWQRGDQVAVPSGRNVYTCDRYMGANEGIASGITIMKHADGLRLVAHSSEKTSSNLRYYFELATIRNYIGKTLTFSTEYKSEYSSSDNWGTNVAFFSTGGAINITDISVKVISIGNGWKRRVYTFRINSIADSVTSLHAQLFRANGASIFGYHIIKYVKLEVGDVATPFIPRLYGEELTLCQRYYEVIDRVFRTTGYTLGDGLLAIEYPFLVEKRVPPTVPIPSNRPDLIEVFGIRNATPSNFESHTTIGGVRFAGRLPGDPNRIVGLNFRTYADAEIY